MARQLIRVKTQSASYCQHNPTLISIIGVVYGCYPKNDLSMEEFVLWITLSISNHRQRNSIKISRHNTQKKTIISTVISQRFGQALMFWPDIDDIIVTFDIEEDDFSLMKAQHIVAYLAGFDN